MDKRTLELYNIALQCPFYHHFPVAICYKDILTYRLLQLVNRKT